MSKALARVALSAIFTLGGLMKLQAWEPVRRKGKRSNGIVCQVRSTAGLHKIATSSLPMLSLPQTLAYTAHGFAKVGLDAALAPLGNPAQVIQIALGIATFLEVAGGVLLALGVEKLGAALLAVFLLAITPIMHWPVKDGQMDQHEMTSLLKNLSLLGAMLYILSSGSAKGGKGKRD
jgi:uncharacterized membrane protein YphA (DoxX/SURF4 family)